MLAYSPFQTKDGVKLIDMDKYDAYSLILIDYINEHKITKDRLLDIAQSNFDKFSLIFPCIKEYPKVRLSYYALEFLNTKMFNEISSQTRDLDRLTFILETDLDPFIKTHGAFNLVQAVERLKTNFSISFNRHDDLIPFDELHYILIGDEAWN